MCKMIGHEIGAFDHYVPCKSTNILSLKHGGSFWIMTHPYYFQMAVRTPSYKNLWPRNSRVYVEYPLSINSPTCKSYDLCSTTLSPDALGVMRLESDKSILSLRPASQFSCVPIIPPIIKIKTTLIKTYICVAALCCRPFSNSAILTGWLAGWLAH